MIGLGTIVNAAAIVAGGLIGQVFGKFLNEKLQNILMLANGLCVIFIGIQGAVNAMNEADTTIMMIISFCIGSIVGQLFDLEGRLVQFGNWIKKITHSENTNGFTSAFVTASLTVCIGAMAIVGSIQDGLFQDPSVLYVKAILDFVIILVMTSAMNKGCIFSAIPVFILQFSITLLSMQLTWLLNPDILNNISVVGNILIFCVGINLVWPNTFSTANMLPALLAAIVFGLF